MCSYNAVNGVPVCLDPLQKAVRDSWGFDGYVTSDTDSIDDAWVRHKYVATGEEAAALGVSKGGCDINSGNSYYNRLPGALAQSLCTMDDIDRRLFNAFKVRFRLGLFDPEHARSPYSKYGAKEIGAAASIALNLRAAEESLVLLQQTDAPTLPLPASGLKLAVVGPHADASHGLIQTDTGMICTDGSYDCVVSPFAALAKSNAGGTTEYSQGCGVVDGNASTIAAAVDVAARADVVVLVLGIYACGKGPAVDAPCDFERTDGSIYLEAEAHDRGSIDLPPVQHQLIDAVLELKKPTVVVLVHGGQLAVERFVGVPHVTLLTAFYPGAEGGHAIARSLFGTSNRWGKLPYTVYTADWTDNHAMFEHNPSHDRRTYRYITPADASQVSFPFGYGLSLTTFSLSSFTNDTVATLHTDGTSPAVEVSVAVANTGRMVGDEMVQAYVVPTSVPGLKVHPLKSLIGFTRLRNIATGAPQSARFSITADDLTMVTDTGDRVREPGMYDVVFETGAPRARRVVVHVNVTGDRRVVDAFPQVPGRE
eukprot:TRINITY_DN5050_c0_g2_i1.p1 TRINITY_DN5050_c0_g2~~TRINITY_DN5050_c0_g2_i1.p1  ORF type:complete len:538 (+),score=111.20 TRINITY_DN5050_c0_g2_i1:308-1921(+)